MLRQKLRKFYKRHKGLTLAVTAIICIILILASVILSTRIPKVAGIDSYDGDNQYIRAGKKSLISASGTGGAAPENTMAAFKYCMRNGAYSVDMLELGLYLTGDNILVILSDDTLDGVSNAAEFFKYKKVKASEKNFAELKSLNMAEYFRSADGNYPFKGLRGNEVSDDIKIVSLDEILLYMRAYTAMRYTFKIHNVGDKGKKAADILYAKMREYNILDKSIASVSDGGVCKYIDNFYPGITRAASPGEVAGFYSALAFNVNLSKKDLGYGVLQIPYKRYGLNFGIKSLVDYAHSHGIAVQYTGVNDGKDIKHLLEIGADGIITGNPETAYKIIYGR